MNYNNIIGTVLSTATTLPIGPMQMEQMQAPPYVVFDLNGVTPLASKVKYEPLDLVEASIMVFHKNLDTAQEEANKIRRVFSCASHDDIESSWIDSLYSTYVEAFDCNMIAVNIAMRVKYTPFTADGIGVMKVGTTFIVV